MKNIIIGILTTLFTNIVIGQIAFEQVPPPPPAPQIIADFKEVYKSSIAFANIDNDNNQDGLKSMDLPKYIDTESLKN